VRARHQAVAGMMDLDWTWQDGARCADRPLELFYTSRAAVSLERDAALALCNGDGGCPARRACLAYAVAANERDGTWGGMMTRERSVLARTRCPRCRLFLGRQGVADMIRAGRQHTRCPRCTAWVEVRPSWERPHRNAHITGTEVRT
jgi:WhiB family redox-sensing transcriptional regulator